MNSIVFTSSARRGRLQSVSGNVLEMSSHIWATAGPDRPVRKLPKYGRTSDHHRSRNRTAGTQQTAPAPQTDSRYALADGLALRARTAALRAAETCSRYTGSFSLKRIRVNEQKLSECRLMRVIE